MNRDDRELKLALDALDARQVPPAVEGWDERLLALLEDDREARPVAPRRRPRLATRVRLLAAACLAIALIVFVASGAAARIGIPNPIELLWPGDRGPKPNRAVPPSAQPTPMPSRPRATPSPDPTESKKANASRPTTRPTAAAALPGGWDGPGGGTTELEPQPTGTHASLCAVDFVGDHGWAVGAAGTVITSDDGGASWTPVSSGDDDWLFDVDFADAQRGWAVGGAYGATILSTSDGGASWAMQSAAVDCLQAVAAVDDQTAWAVGYGEGHDARVLATTDGETWNDQQAPDVDGPLLDVSAVDPQHAWAISQGGAIIATRDGTSWTVQYLSGLTLTSVCFLDRDRGWVTAFRGGGIYSTSAVLLSTSDGGQTWQQESAGAKGTVLDEVVFVDSRHGWATGRYQKRMLCLATSDGGTTWRTWDVPRRRSAGAVAAVGSSGACAVGVSGAVYLFGND